MMSLYKITDKASAEKFVREYWKKEDQKLVTSLVEMYKRESSMSRPFHTFYQEDKVEGEDYVICPLLGYRRVRLDARYTKSIGFTEYSDYEKQFPGTPKAASALAKNIASGLNEVDPTTGLTKYELSQVAARETLLSVGADGLTGDQRRGIKTQAGLLEKTSDGRSVAAVAAQARNEVIMGDGRTLQQHAVEKAFNTQMINGNFGGNVSGQATVAFAPIKKLLEENNIAYRSDEGEYAVTYAVNIREGEWPINSIGKHKALIGKKLYQTKEEASKHRSPGEITQTGVFKYDLVISEFNLNIEFNGLNVHPDPSLPKEKWDAWSFSQRGETINADQKRAYDLMKLNWLKETRGIDTVEIWGPNGDVGGCLELIKAHLSNM